MEFDWRHDELNRPVEARRALQEAKGKARHTILRCRDRASGYDTLRELHRLGLLTGQALQDAEKLSTKCPKARDFEIRSSKFEFEKEGE